MPSGKIPIQKLSAFNPLIFLLSPELSRSISGICGYGFIMVVALFFFGVIPPIMFVFRIVRIFYTSGVFRNASAILLPNSPAASGPSAVMILLSVTT